MNMNRHTAGRRPPRAREKGVVLFIALIVLVAMTLAGIAMFRQIGSGVIIAGNIAFKENATSVGDFGIEAARAYLVGSGSSALQADQAPGYISSWALTFNPTTHNWSSNSTLVTSDDGTGNEVRYVIHRLCANPGSVNDPTQTCVTVGTASAGGSKGGGSYGVLPLSNTTAPYFRITARVTGPRNTVSYVQSIMY
jgi:type IV pilus assembly protein PilX